jgi:hypothetical protein
MDALVRQFQLSTTEGQTTGRPAGRPRRYAATTNHGKAGRTWTPAPAARAAAATKSSHPQRLNPAMLIPFEETQDDLLQEF